MVEIPVAQMAMTEHELPHIFLLGSPNDFHKGPQVQILYTFSCLSMNACFHVKHEGLGFPFECRVESMLLGPNIIVTNILYTVIQKGR